MPSISKGAYRAAVALAILTFVSACASGGPGGKRPGGKGGGRGGDRGGEMQQGASAFPAGTPDFNALYRRTMEIKAAGDCNAALPALQTLAQQGHGYDGAQQALGECLIQTAAADSQTAQLEGLIWLRRAAEAGRAEAQGALALFYLNGPLALQDEQEALFWYALYKDSLRRGRVGLVPLEPQQEQILATTFDAAALAQVADAVASWQPIIWTPPQDMRLEQNQRPRRAGGAGEFQEPGQRPDRRMG